jgi:hypothetical protein
MTKLEKLFGSPKHQVETDIAAFLTPLMSEDSAAEAIKNKLTLSGCFKHTHDKAKSSKVDGVACPSYKQVMKWSCGYFGISTKGLAIPETPVGVAAPNPPPKLTPIAAATGAVNMDFDALFD